MKRRINNPSEIPALLPVTLLLTGTRSNTSRFMSAGVSRPLQAHVAELH